jgi:hypothetical protein
VALAHQNDLEVSLLLFVPIFDFSEAGFASGWSADIPVRSVPGLNTEADKNVRAAKNQRCAPPVE